MSVFLSSCGQTQINVPQDNISKGHYSESQLKENSAGNLAVSLAATSKVPVSMVRNVKQARNGDILIASYLGVFRYDGNIYKLASEALEARNICLRLLEDEKTTYMLKVIYFSDREKLRPYINMAPKGIALPDAHTLLIVTNDTLRAYHTHELMHIISIDRFGGYAAEPSDWIQEGMSVYADNSCMGYSIHALGAYLHHTKKMPSLDSLFTQFRALPDMIAYMYSGSFTWFIIDKYGIEKFEHLWKQGVGNLSSVIGKTKGGLEKEYHKFLLQKYPQQPDIDWELLSNKGCG